MSNLEKLLLDSADLEVALEELAIARADFALVVMLGVGAISQDLYYDLLSELYDQDSDTGSQVRDIFLAHVQASSSLVRKEVRDHKKRVSKLREQTENLYPVAYSKHGKDKATALITNFKGAVEEMSANLSSTISSLQTDALLSATEDAYKYIVSDRFS
jgi:hypothetical protein